MRFFKKDLQLFNNPKLMIVFLLVLLMVPIGVVKAQDYEPQFGVKAGVNISNLYFDDVDDENSRTGFQLGVTSKFPIAEFVAIQPELLFTQKGAKVMRSVGSARTQADFRLNYIEMPILVMFDLGKFFNIHAGVYGSYLLGADMDYDDDFFEIEEGMGKKNFQTIDYGLVGGIGFNFTDDLSLGIRYNYGVRGIGKENYGARLKDVKNSVAQFYVALGL